jgi:hypothetical protein
MLINRIEGDEGVILYAEIRHQCVTGSTPVMKILCYMNGLSACFEDLVICPKEAVPDRIS